jgi:6-phosphogluconolactonase
VAYGVAVDIEVLADETALARRGARVIAERAREAVAVRGGFTLAVSGGSTPGVMLRALAGEALPWAALHVFQVDERVAPDGHPDRNLNGLRDDLVSRVDLPDTNLHPMPVTAEDLDAAAAAYGAELVAVCGAPPVLDLVHLGLGDDGHTASWAPGDPVGEIDDADVALSGVYRGRRRMTLTVPAVNRARGILWLVSGEGKADALARVLAGDQALPGSLVRQEHVLVLADRAAAQRVARTNWNA